MFALLEDGETAPTGADSVWPKSGSGTDFHSVIRAWPLLSNSSLAPFIFPGALMHKLLISPFLIISCVLTALPAVAGEQPVSIDVPGGKLHGTLLTPETPGVH